MERILPKHQLQPLCQSLHESDGKHRTGQQGQHGHHQELRPRQLAHSHAGHAARHPTGQRRDMDTAIQRYIHEAMAHDDFQRTGQKHEPAHAVTATGQHRHPTPRLAAASRLQHAHPRLRRLELQD